MKLGEDLETEHPELETGAPFIPIPVPFRLVSLLSPPHDAAINIVAVVVKKGSITLPFKPPTHKKRIFIFMSKSYAK